MTRPGKRAGFSCCRGEPVWLPAAWQGRVAAGLTTQLWLATGVKTVRASPVGTKLAAAELRSEVLLGSQNQGLVPIRWTKASESGPGARAIGRCRWAEGSYSRSTGAGGRRPAPGAPPGARRPGP